MGKKILVLISSAIFLSGCSTKFKQKVGIVTTGPNEYKVQTNKPLDVPPHYDLPIPSATTKENIDKNHKNS